MEYFTDFLSEFWNVTGEMSPYLLLGFLIAGIISVVLKPEFVRRHLGGGGLFPIFKASAFGVPLPVCSCGVIPIATSLKREGASTGATASFLISTPQTGVDSIAATLSLLGPVYAIFRPVVAFVSGIVGGLIVGRFEIKEDTGAKPVPGAFNCSGGSCEITPASKGGNKLIEMFRYGFVTLPRDISKALLVGLVLAGVIAVFLPDELFAEHLSSRPLQMLVMMVIGIPMYVCSTASIPIAASLILKGVSPGAALVFLVTGPATNMATFTTIWKILGKKATVAYLLVIAVSAIVFGIVLDSFYEHTNAKPVGMMHEMTPAWLMHSSAVVMLAIIGYALFGTYVRRKRRLARMSEEVKAGGFTLQVMEMKCEACRTKIEEYIKSFPGVESAAVDLGAEKATILGKNIDIELLSRKITELGYPSEPLEGDSAS